MGDRTVVDTAGLVAAARVTGRASTDVRGSAARVRAALAALAGELPGALTGREAAALVEAVGGVLGELAEALGEFGLLLSVAAVRYADAEDAATAAAEGSAGSVARTASARP